MSDTRPPVCGDDECENPSCQPESYDAYVDQLGRNLRTLLGVPEGEQGVRLLDRGVLVEECADDLDHRTT